MRKIASILIMVTLLVSLTGCSVKVDVAEVDKMYIQEAELTDKEKALVNMVTTDEMPYMVEFSLDDTVKSWQNNIYELEGDQWKFVSGGIRQFDETQGKIAFSFDNIGYGMRIAIENRGSNSYEDTPDFDFEGMGTSNAYLTNQKEVVYEKEIPLVIQVHTSKNNIQCILPEYGFENPKLYSEAGYEKVYALTCLFSQKTVKELSDMKK